MKIAITGEGPIDYGRNEYDKKADDSILEKGAAEGYAEKLASGRQIDWYFAPRAKVQEFEFQGRHSSIKKELAAVEGDTEGKALNAARFVSFVSLNFPECEYAIYYSDADRSTGMKNSQPDRAKKRFDEVYHQIEAGLQVQKDTLKSIPMVALRIIENWLLADQNCLCRLLHISQPVIDRNGHFELLWGDEANEKSHHPKCLLNAMRKQADKRWSGISPYDIAREENPKVLAQNCPTSFGRFKEDFCKIIEDSELAEK
ncbi:MAG: hypothetical protein VZQ80_07605 [Lachnospiraceae bacterium]|nr:hypothetical protein [Lachnospiraceae bacterium]